MAKYVFIYTGATKGASQENWTSWFESLGDRVAEAGYPFFGASATFNSSGVTGGGASSAGGYTVVNADSIDEATTVAKGCPIVPSGERGSLRGVRDVIRIDQRPGAPEAPGTFAPQVSQFFWHLRINGEVVRAARGAGEPPAIERPTSRAKLNANDPGLRQIQSDAS